VRVVTGTQPGGTPVEAGLGYTGSGGGGAVVGGGVVAVVVAGVVVVVGVSSWMIRCSSATHCCARVRWALLVGLAARSWQFASRSRAFCSWVVPSALAVVTLTIVTAAAYSTTAAVAVHAHLRIVALRLIPLS
jgi:hypothetical protein